MGIYDDLITKAQTREEEEQKRGIKETFKRAAEGVTRFFLPKSIEEKIFGPEPEEKADVSTPRLAGSIYDDLLPDAPKKKEEEEPARPSIFERESFIGPVQPGTFEERPRLSARERIEEWGRAWQDYEAREARETRLEELEQFRGVVDQDYKEPEGFWGQLGETIREATAATLSTFGAGLEARGRSMVDKRFVDLGIKMQNKFDKILIENPEWSAPTDLEKWKDKRFYARLVGGVLPSVLGSVATLVAGVVAGPIVGPVVAGGVGFGLFGTLEAGSAYEDALSFGASDSDARSVASIVGNINGAIELAFPGTILLRRFGIFKPFTGSLTRRLTVAFTEGVLTEGVFEEGSQTIIANIVAKSYDENRGALDGILENIVGGSLVGGPFGLIFGGGSTRTTGKREEKEPTPQPPPERPAPQARESTEDTLNSNVEEYVRSGGFTPGTQVENAALRDISAILDTGEGKVIARDRVQTAIENDVIEVGKDGLVDIFRAGEVGEGTGLVSFTLSREVAVNFQEQAKNEGREVPLIEEKVKPEEIALLIRGEEQEVLVRLEVVEAVAEQARGIKKISEVSKELKSVPKGEIIANPTKRIETVPGVDFTRRSLKHVVEKDNVTDDFIQSIPDILSNPTEIRVSDHATVNRRRLLFIKARGNDLADVVVVESVDGVNTIVTVMPGGRLSRFSKMSVASREEGNIIFTVAKEEKPVKGVIPTKEKEQVERKPTQVVSREEAIQSADKIIEDSEIEIRRIYGEKENAQTTLKGLLQEMDEAQAGERVFIERPDSGSPDILAISSTFPEWVESENRSKALFKKVFDGLLDVSKFTYPKGNRSRQRSLYNDVLEELDTRLKIDTKNLRDAIIEAYDIKSQKVSEEDERGVEGRALPARTAEEIREAREEAEGGITTETLDKLFRGEEEVIEGEEGAPTGFASKGLFREGEPIELGELQTIRPIEFPELVDIARELSESPPSVKKIRGKAIGVLRVKTGKIEIEPDLFTKDNHEQLTGVLAHEIGHLIDFLPERTMKRGNLLGHLLSLRKHLKNTFEDTLVTNKEIREELKDLSNFWRPWNEATASRSEKQYRNKSSELYADFISVLFNNPGLAQKRVPLFYEAFFESLDKKPAVKDAYFSIQDLLTGGRENLIKNRREGVRGMFDEGDYKSAELQRARTAERKAREEDIRFRIRFDLVDKTTAVRDRVQEIQKKGIEVKDDDNPIYYLEDSNYLGGKIKALIKEGPQAIYGNLKRNGISWTDFGEALFYKRIIDGDRTDVANPRGITPKAAQELMDTFKIEMGEGKFAILEREAGAFQTWLRSISEEAFDEGLYTPELHKQMQDNPSYVTFQVVEHLEDGMSSKVYHQIGTLKDIANPADATILKAIATLKAIEKNKVNRSILQFLQEHFPDEVTDAKKIFTGKGFRFLDPRGEFENLMGYFEKGKFKGFEVDTYIAQSVERNTIAQNNIIIGTLRFFNSKLFRPLFITFNLGFQTFNLVRDFFRYWKNIPGMSMHSALKGYKQALRPAKVRAFGLPKNPSAADLEADRIITQLEHEQVLSVTFNDIVLGQDIQDKQIEEILKKSGVFENEVQTKVLLKPFIGILNWIKSMGDLVETIPKVAGYYELEGTLPPKELRSFVRRKVGSPDFLIRGRWTSATNEIFLFSNAIIQAIRADIEIATQPKTRSGFWWKTVALNFLPKIFMFAAILGLFGDNLEDMMEDASEYDKTNYTIIPIGRDSRTGKTIYIRVPQDETGRTLGGLFWKILNIFRSEQSAIRNVTDIISYTGGQLPSVSPTIGAFSSTAQFLSGQNPYDTFRGRNVLTDDQFNAGGTEALKPFLIWQFQQLGGGTFVKIYPSTGVPREKSPGEKFLALPFLSNVIGRFIKISDYGEVQQLREITQNTKSDRARERLEEGRILNDYVRKWQSDEITNKSQLKNEFVLEVLGHQPKNKEEADKRKRLLKKLDVALIKGQADPKINALIVAVSNDEKLALLRAYKKTMTPAEFSELRSLVLNERIVNKSVFQELSRIRNAE